MARSYALRHVPFLRRTLLVALGVAIGCLATSLVVTPTTTQAAVRNQYKVERLDSMAARQTETFQQLLDERAAEGWLLQALDHEILVFRKAPAAAARPSPTPEP